MVEDFKSMPRLLKFITAHGLFCFLFFLTAVIPGFDLNFSYKGQSMGFKEIWQSGLGIDLILIGLLFPTSAFLLLKKWQYCRQFYALILLGAFVISNANGENYIYLPFTLIIPCLLISGTGKNDPFYCFYLKSSAVLL